MHSRTLAPWTHEHTFGHQAPSGAERRVRLVAALTAVFMVVELVAGWWSGSMALIADGLHMGSHAVALGISVAAYAYARRHARDDRYSFGTGKVNALGGFTGALLLALFALVMVWESGARVLQPVQIAFEQAIAVAVIGLAVNGVSVLLLGGHDHEHDDHDHEHAHAHAHAHHDHNHRSAYVHVLADTLTSVLAIVALLGAKLGGWTWLDPLMGFVGAALVSRWAWGLLRDTSAVLLDRQAPAALRARLQAAFEADGDTRLADLHVWSIGPGVHAACASLVTHGSTTPEQFKALIPAEARIGHVTLEVHRCLEPAG